MYRIVVGGCDMIDNRLMVENLFGNFILKRQGTLLDYSEY